MESRASHFPSGSLQWLRSSTLLARAVDRFRQADASGPESVGGLGGRHIPWLEHCESSIVDDLVSLNDGKDSNWFFTHPVKAFKQCWPGRGFLESSDEDEVEESDDEDTLWSHSSWMAEKWRGSSRFGNGSEASEPPSDNEPIGRSFSKSSLDTLEAVVGAVVHWSPLHKKYPSEDDEVVSTSANGDQKGTARRLMEQVTLETLQVASAASGALRRKAAAEASRLTSDPRIHADEDFWLMPSTRSNYVTLETTGLMQNYPRVVARLAKLASQDALMASQRSLDVSRKVSGDLLRRTLNPHEVQRLSRKLWHEAPDLAAMSVKLWQDAPDTRAIATISKLWQEAPGLGTIFTPVAQKSQEKSQHTVLSEQYDDEGDENKPSCSSSKSCQDTVEARLEIRGRTEDGLQLVSSPLQCHMLFASPLCIERFVVVKLSAAYPLSASVADMEASALGLSFEDLRPSVILEVQSSGRVAEWNSRQGHPEEMVRPGDELVRLSYGGIDVVARGRPHLTVFHEASANTGKSSVPVCTSKVPLELVFRALRALPPLRINPEIMALKRSGCQVVARAATVQNIRALVSSGRCQILHMSLHCANAQQPLLFLEDGSGKAHVIRSSELQALLGRGQQKQPILIAFLNSCHSMSFGLALIAVGVRHVVCVREDDEVRDESCRLFAHEFFGALCAGRSVREAFDCGVAILSFSQKLPLRDDASSFVLLPSCLDGNHDAVYFCSKTPCVQSRTIIDGGGWGSVLPPAEDFVGREVEIHRILRILHIRRFVVVCGAPGVGKSAVLAEVGRFVILRSEPFEEVRWVDGHDERSCEECFHGVLDLRDRLLESPQRRVLLLVDDLGATSWNHLLPLLRFEYVHFVVAARPVDQGWSSEGSLGMGLKAVDEAATMAGLKSVHIPLGPLDPLAQARLFLRRASRPLCTSDLGVAEAGQMIAPELSHSELLAVAATPRLRSLGGNPRRIIAAAQALHPNEHSAFGSEPPDLDSVPGSLSSTPRGLRRVRLARPDGRVRDEWIRSDARISEILLNFAPKGLEGMVEAVVMGCRADPAAILVDFPDDELEKLLVLELRPTSVNDW